MTFIESFNSNI